MSTVFPNSFDVEDGDLSPGAVNLDQNQDSSSSTSGRNAKVWKDLVAEIGFHTYTEYLEQWTQYDPKLSKLVEELKLPPLDSWASPISIYDIQKLDNIPTSVHLRAQCSSGTAFLESLQRPPKDVCVQLVLWPASWLSSATINRDLLDAVGLRFDVDPKYFVKLMNVQFAGLQDVNEL